MTAFLVMGYFAFAFQEQEMSYVRKQRGKTKYPMTKQKCALTSMAQRCQATVIVRCFEYFA